MPIFHFNLDDHVREEDPEGTELSGLDEARVEAVIFAGAYLRDNPGLVWDEQPFIVEVTRDDSDKVLFRVTVQASTID